MDGPADLGGTPGWGPVHAPARDEPIFAEPWQRRAFALAILSSRAASGGVNTDAFRHAQVVAGALEDVLVGVDAVSTDEVTARAQTLARRPPGHDQGVTP
ncbi:hypothetical protein ABZ357_06830 [Streptomyces sp. NPDC005917]|uniref:hypothetical protein n=1 Tax=unclassified Streptomyces TaxID=2593676 RepID=UPI0033FB5165